MKVLDIRYIPINKIHENPNQHRENIETDIEQMAKSIEKIGLLNPLTVRPYNGEYQIVAGERRFRAVKILGLKEIQAKIVEADDVETDIMSIAENYHRKDLSEEERDKSVYAAWKRGKDTIFENKISVMSEWTAIPLTTLKRIIAGCEEKENLKSEIIQKATSSDLERTRSLDKISPEIREELLELEQSGTINALDLEPIVEAIKTAKDTNTSEELIKWIPKFISEKKIDPSRIEDFVKKIAEIPQNLQKELVEMASKEKIIEPALNIEPVVKGIKTAKETNMTDEIIKDISKLISEKKIIPTQTEDFVKAIADAPIELQKDVIEVSAKEEEIKPDKVKIFVNVLKDSKPDIQKKLLRKEIDIEEAKIANEFPREDQRDQIIEEIRTTKEETKKDFERHIKIRKRQAEEIKQGKEPKDLTRADIERFKKINANSFEQQDMRMLQFYRNQLMNLILKADDIKSMHFDANKKEAINIIWKIYERAYKVLIELGEIKVLDISPKTSPVNPKMLYGK